MTRISSSLTTTALLAAALAACSNDSSEACLDEESPDMGGFPSAATHRGSATLERLLEYAAGSSKLTNSIVVRFSDLSYAEMSSAPGDRKGDATCFGFTGAPTKVCKKNPPCTIEFLDAKGVRVEGLAPGTLQLTRTSTGAFSNLAVAEPMFGATPGKIVVSGDTATGYFPSYEQSLQPPDLLTLESPDPAGTKPVGVGDIEVRWNAGNGDYVVLEIRDVNPTVTDHVRCVVKDDGCHTLLGADILEWLEIQSGEQFKLTVRRDRRAVKSLDGITAVQLGMLARTVTTLTR